MYQKHVAAIVVDEAHTITGSSWR